MRNYFIYQYEDFVSCAFKFKVTAIFIHQAVILSQNQLAEEINVFFQEHSVTDKLVVILPEYLQSRSKSFFFDERDSTFLRIPGRSREYLDTCLVVYQFNLSGGLDLISGRRPQGEKKFKELLFRSGATLIFINNGGLVESTPDHHFVFPSNKHCEKFIRTGNVLINQTEVFFLALMLLKHFEERNVIYCDTSSINVLPYAVFELRRRFGIDFECPTIHSFASYELFESHQETFPPDCLLLISSSTSGNIIDRILREKRADQSQIQVIYFLGPNEKYLNHRSNIICNLTCDDTFPLGVEEFETFDNSENCKLCFGHSRPIHIRSDVFLTIQPRIESHLLTVKTEYAPKDISPFVELFRGRSPWESVLKVFFKDNDANADYEIYFDFSFLIQNVLKFPKFQRSIERHINKSIPANTRYLLHLPDIGSQRLAEYIITKIPASITPELVKLDSKFIDKIQDVSCSLVIIASCITTGKKLLQISRLMRNHELVNLIYFVGIFRPINERFSIDLINDLRKGKNKSDERPFIAIEKMYCSILQRGTSWDLERSFLGELLSYIEEDRSNSLYRYVDDRLNVLRDNKKHRGLSDKVFLATCNGESLYLRKNFAFWEFDDYDRYNVSQSEVYFTISSIVTHLRNKDINARPSLKQTNYVRNVLSPRNFHRFNDGIIQAALLRCSEPEYLSYDLDGESSLKMKEFLLSIIEKFDLADGEALPEFLLAIGVKKLKLKREDIKEVLTKAAACSNAIISGLAEHVLKTGQ